MDFLYSSVKYFLLILVTHLQLPLGQSVTFVLQPQDTNVVIGKNAFFPCTYFGTREVPHWLVNCTTTHTVSTLPSGHSHNGTGLTVHNVDISMNASKYQCCFEIYVGGGIFNETCSSTGRLIVSGGFIQHPSAVETTPGEPGVFHCTAVTANIQWKINCILMIDSNAVTYSTRVRSGVGILSSMLYVQAAPQLNNSEIQCCAYDEIGGELCTNPVNLTTAGVQVATTSTTTSSTTSSHSASFASISSSTTSSSLTTVARIAICCTAVSTLLPRVFL